MEIKNAVNPVEETEKISKFVANLKNGLDNLVSECRIAEGCGDLSYLLNGLSNLREKAEKLGESGSRLVIKLEERARIAAQYGSLGL